MKIECPSCNAVGKIDETKLPAGGANIRCPSCTAVFYVRAPAEAGAQTTSESAVGPADRAEFATTRSPARVRGDDSSPPRGPAESGAAPFDSNLGSSRSGAPGQSGLGRSRPGQSGLGSRTPIPPGQSGLGHSGSRDAARDSSPGRSGPSGRYESGLGSGGAIAPPFDSGLGDTQPDDSGLGSRGTSTSTDDTQHRISGQPAAVAPREEDSAGPDLIAPDALTPADDLEDGTQEHSGMWRIRAESGMVYDFPSTSAVRSWLGSRGTLKGLDASANGGESWRPVAMWKELGSVRAQGLRTISVPRSMASRTTVGLDVRVASGGEDAVHTPRPFKSDAARRLAEKSGPRAVPAAGDRQARRSQEKAQRSKEKARRSKDKLRRHKRRQQTDEDPHAARKRLLGLLLMLIVVALGATFAKTKAAGPRLPNTPAGMQMRWVLDAMNGGASVMTEQQVAAMFSDTVLAVAPAQRLLQELQYWDGRHPEYRFAGVQGRSTDTAVSVIVVTPAQQHGVITIEVEPTPPHRLTSCTVRSAD